MHKAGNWMGIITKFVNEMIIRWKDKNSKISLSQASLWARTDWIITGLT